MKKTKQPMSGNKVDYYRKKSMFFKTDVLIILLVIVAIIVSIIFLTNKTKGQTVEIYYKGELIETHSLSSNKEIIIEKNNTYNKIIIKNGIVYMADADCSNQLCVKSAGIQYVNQRIICAPNGIVIIIKGNNDVDGITGGHNAN